MTRAGQVLALVFAVAIAAAVASGGGSDAEDVEPDATPDDPDVKPEHPHDPDQRVPVRPIEQYQAGGDMLLLALRQQSEDDTLSPTQAVAFALQEAIAYDQKHYTGGESQRPYLAAVIERAQYVNQDKVGMDDPRATLGKLAEWASRYHVGGVTAYIAGILKTMGEDAGGGPNEDWDGEASECHGMDTFDVILPDLADIDFKAMGADQMVGAQLYGAAQQVMANDYCAHFDGPPDIPHPAWWDQMGAPAPVIRHFAAETFYRRTGKEPTTYDEMALDMEFAGYHVMEG